MLTSLSSTTPGALLFSALTIARLTGVVSLPKGVTVTGGATVDQINVTTAAGPNIRSGTGAATGTQPAGSLWLRTDGTTANRLYVSGAGGGTWAAVRLAYEIAHATLVPGLQGVRVRV